MRVVAIIALLLAVFVGLLTQSVRQQSQTADESIHLFAGYQYWKHLDFGVNPEHPPLAKLVAAAPLLRLPLKVQPMVQGDVKESQLIPSIEFVNRNTLPQQELIGRGRMAMAGFAVLLFVLVVAAAGEVWKSAWAAAAAAFLIAFEPNVLAHGALITTDVAASAMIFAAVYAYYRYLHHTSIERLVVAGLAAGAALAVKHNGAIVFPMLFLLGLRYQRVKRLQALIAIPVIALAVLWFAYRFQAGRPDGYSFVPAAAEVLWDVKSPVAKAVISTLNALHLVPQSYLWGMADVAKAVANGRQTFLFGEMYREGVWYFFPAVFLMKATLPFLFLLGFLLVSRAWREQREGVLVSPWFFFGLPAAVYFAVSLGSGMNLGIRHLLPVFPFLILLAAEGLRRVFTRWKSVGAVLLVWHAGTAVYAYPNYLPYSNELVGGVPKTYRVMADSNADWGQGLLQTAAYLKSRNITGDCWIAYWLGHVDPKDYGIPCQPLQSGPGALYGHVVSPEHPAKIKGTVLVSASNAAGMVMYVRDRNPYRPFLEAKPDAVIGGAMLAFHGEFDVTLAAAWNHVARFGVANLEGRRAEALEEARKAMEVAPDAWDIRRNLCWTMKRLVYTAEQTAPYCTAAGDR
ncbi:glycosyl transferase [Bryobacterales bacterium F-183]|nr:glycosyl transferase [Bryobacterales bacterium F-183]